MEAKKRVWQRTIQALDEAAAEALRLVAWAFRHQETKRAVGKAVPQIIGLVSIVISALVLTALPQFGLLQ